MADCLITHLEGDVIAHIKDIITVSPAPADIYTRIKDRIISGFAESAETRLRRLLKGEVSFDGKPSVLLNRYNAVPTLPLSQLSSSAVSNETPTESLEAKVDWLVREIKKLQSKTSKPQLTRSRSKSRSSSKNRNPRDSSQHNDEKKICFYHKKFGDKAKYCKGACSWIGKSDSEN